MKKTWILTLIVAIPISLLAENTPIEIHTAEELAAIGTNDQAMEESYILMTDIIVENWTPIDSSDKHGKYGFEGILDGNGHTITILSFDLQPDYSRVGLFGLIGKKGMVKNLRITGKVSYTGEQKFLYIGGIAGVNEGLIQCCSSTMDLTVDFLETEVKKKVKCHFGYDTGQYGGCISGINFGFIKHCYSEGSIHVSQGTAGGITAANGRPIMGSFGISVGSGGVSMSASPGVAAPSDRAAISYCYSTATVSGTTACGITALYRADSASMFKVVALNPLLEAKGLLSLASPFPRMGTMSLSHPNFQFYYRNDVVTRRYNEKNVEKKPAKMSPKRAIALSATHQESWWRLPEGLTSKEEQKILGFPFGDDEESPWKWDDDVKRPVLYWEMNIPEE